MPYGVFFSVGSNFQVRIMLIILITLRNLIILTTQMSLLLVNMNMYDNPTDPSNTPND